MEYGSRGGGAWFGAVLFVAAAVSAAPVAAQEAGADATREPWRFEVTPYFFAAGMDGSAGVGQVSGDVDMGVGDLLDRLDGAFMGTVEARKGRLGLLFDGMYVHLKDESTRSWQGPGGIGTSTGELTTNVTQNLYNLAVARRVVDDEGATADLIVGARYTSLDTRLDLVFTTGGLLPGNVASIDDQQSWWDPIFGFRLLVPFAEHWASLWYADLGGFGMGSDLTAQGIVGVNWAFAKHFSAKFGYRYIFQDYSDDGFVWDMATHGLYAGVGIKF
ncbi:MAG: hypothetical protein ACOYXU_08005 [Nitrospirota bacterium]